MAIIDHLSYSQIALYMECPREYYFKYIRYPDARKEVDSDVFRLGRAYHEAMEDIYRNKSLGEVINNFEAGIEGCSNYLVRDKQSLRDAVVYYMTDVFPMYDGLVRELEVDVKDFMIEGVEVPIHLRLDLATIDDRIIDHKTVGWQKPKAKRNKQLLLYAYYYLKKYGKLPRKVEIHSAFKNPKGEQLVEIDSTEVDYSDVLRVVDLVRNIYFLIKNDIFPCYMARGCESSPYKAEFDSILQKNNY